MNVAEIDALRREADAAETRARQARSHVAQIERDCPHNRDEAAWTQPERSMEPFKQEVIDWGATEYRGVDVFHHTRFVDSTRPVWTRRCRHCGKVETTHETKPSVQQVPTFR